MALLNHKNGICAYGKREFYTYVKCISRVRMEFFLVACVLHLTRHSSLTQLARNLALAQYNKGRMVFVSAEFGSKLDIQNVARWIFFLFLNSFVKIYLRRI